MTAINKEVNEIKLHDVVKLTCGGYPMVVTDFDVTWVSCMWHKADGTLECENFDREILQVIPRVDGTSPPTPAVVAPKSE